MNINRLISGLILISFGVIVILINFGILPPNVISQLIKLWPIFLILLGVKLIIGNQKLTLFWTIIIILIIFCGMIFTIATSYYQTGRQASISKANLVRKIPTGYLLNIDISFAGGKIEISHTDSNRFSLSSSGLPVKFRKTVTDESINLSLSQQSPSFFDDLINPRPNSWSLKIPRNVKTSINYSSGASSAKFDFSKINLRSLTSNIGASDLRLRFGDMAKKLKVKINAGATSIKIRIPKIVGTKINWASGLSGLDLPGNIKKVSRNEFRSKNYSSSKKKIDIAMSTGVSNVEVSN